METRGAASATRARRQALSREKRWLVTSGDEIGKLAGGSRDWASQGRGLWEATRRETEPLVLANLLRYQYARNPDTWTRPVFERLEAAFAACIEKAAGDEALAIDLLQHLLVYTLRSYTFHREGKPVAGKKP